MSSTNIVLLFLSLLWLCADSSQRSNQDFPFRSNGIAAFQSGVISHRPIDLRFGNRKTERSSLARKNAILSVVSKSSTFKRVVSWLADRFRRTRSPEKPKVGIFLDAENLRQFIKADGGRRLIEYAEEFGSPVLRKAYGDWSLPSLNAHQFSLVQNGFQLIHTPHPIPKKNSADIAMAVDVMDTWHRMDDLDCFILATGDSDFSQLFWHLRQAGRRVVGVGPRSVLSDIVGSSTDRFIYTDADQAVEKENATDVERNQMQRAEAHALLERVLDGLAEEPIEAGRLKLRMLSIDGAFSHKALGHTSFTSFLNATGLVHLHRIDKGNCMAKLVTRRGRSHPDTDEPAAGEWAGSDSGLVENATAAAPSRRGPLPPAPPSPAVHAAEFPSDPGSGGATADAPAPAVRPSPSPLAAVAAASSFVEAAALGDGAALGRAAGALRGEAIANDAAAALAEQARRDAGFELGPPAEAALAVAGGSGGTLAAVRAWRQLGAGRWPREDGAAAGTADPEALRAVRGLERLLLVAEESREARERAEEAGGPAPAGDQAAASPGTDAAGAAGEELPWSARLPPNEQKQEWKRAYCCPTCNERFSAWLRCLEHLQKRKHVRPFSYDTKENLRRMLRLPHRDAPLPAVVAAHFRNPDAPPLPPPRRQTVRRSTALSPRQLLKRAAGGGSAEGLPPTPPPPAAAGGDADGEGSDSAGPGRG